MTAFSSVLSNIPSMSSGASQSTGPNDNRSINIFAGGGTDAGLNQLLNLANGPSSNGGIGDRLGSVATYSGLARNEGVSKHSGALLWVAVLLGGFLLIRKLG